MKRRSEDRARAIATLLLMGLLIGIGVRQWHSIDEISRVERERMLAALRGSVDAMGRDFDHEINAAHAQLQIGAAMLDDGDWPAYAKQWEQWESSAAAPKIVQAVWLADQGEDERVRLRRFDRPTRKLVEDPLPASLAPFRAEIERQLRTPRVLSTIVASIPAVLTPVLEIGVAAGNPPTIRTRAVTVLMFDLEAIRRDLLPQLSRRYFSAGDYRLSVVAADRVIFDSGIDRSTPPDAERGLFSLQMRNASPAISALAEGRRTPALITMRTVESSSGTRLGAALAPQWKLHAQHRAGSLETAVRRARFRNAAMSLSVLALLAVSIAFTWSSARRAQRLARQQMDFVAAVSHELRTPVATIRATSDNLARGLVDSPARIREYGELLQSAGLRLSEMVEHVLEFARTDSVDMRELPPAAVSDAIDVACRMTRFAAEQNGARIDVSVPGDLPRVRADVPALARAIENLIANALKYSDGGAVIDIRASSRNGSVVIEVEDRGRGIAAEDLPHIFEPFYRGAGVAAAQIAGTGLGLAVVQRVVAAHGGRVRVDSVAGRGTTFSISLPAVSE